LKKAVFMIFVVANVDPHLCTIGRPENPILFIEYNNISVPGICHGLQLMFCAFCCGPFAIKITNFRVLSTQAFRLESEIQAAA
jgi:hypothetical protein